MEDSGRLADYIATNLPNLSIVSKQFVLEQSSVRERLDYLNTELAKELEVLELRSKIQNQVQEEVGKSQREYFLREQLRAIQRELERATTSARNRENFARKMESSGMPEEARKEADRELDWFGKIPAASRFRSQAAVAGCARIRMIHPRKAMAIEAGADHFEQLSS